MQVTYNDSQFNDNNSTCSTKRENNNNVITFTVSLSSSSKIESIIESSDEKMRV